VNKRPEIGIHSVQRDEVPEVEWVESGKAVLQVSLFFRVLSKIFFGQRWLSPSPPQKNWPVRLCPPSPLLHAINMVQFLHGTV